MNPKLELTSERVAEFLRVLELMAAGDTGQRLAISDVHDELDAIAHGINVLVGELGWTTARIIAAQQEKTASAERESTAKNIFFRNMSHELRTPIAAMLSFADLLASPDLPSPDQPHLVRRLQANGRAVLSLLDDVLDLARLDAKKLVFNPEPVCVIDLVREVLASVQVGKRAKGLQMRVQASDETLGFVRTDRYRLRQILVNLVSNAVKFTEAGTVTVTLTTDVNDLNNLNNLNGDESWTIDIADTGIGITDDRRQRLFEPFEQGEPSIAPEYGGHGLGLSLSRKLAEQMGGALVLLHSAPGEGSTFRLTLTPIPRTAEPVSDREPSVHTRSIAGLRLLLAEDHRDLHFALRQMLEREGATVESAHDGAEAVAKATSADFDAVLMDLRMPNLNGIQATRALRKDGYARPIIALTADPATLWRADALQAGCDACLSKPFKPDDLISVIWLSARPSAL